MKYLRPLTVLLLGTTSLFAAFAARAADLVINDPGTIVQPDTDLPAVSGINGKWELDPGILTSSAGVRAAGSVSIPLGKSFGLQLDGQGLLNGNGLTYGGAVHAFTRNPSSYLAGITAGFVRAPGATLGAVGFEGELYLNEFSIEGWAGVAGLDYVNPALLDKTGVFAIGDVAYYATPDWRMSLGGSYVLGDTALHLGTEYQFQGLGAPLSITGDARLHTNGSYTLTVGLKGYFGGDDPQKTLINRHRQDDPPNRGIDLFTAAGDQLYATPPTTTPPTTTPPVDLEQLCLDTESSNTDWIWLPGPETCVPNIS
jgi:hypothetical protein